MLQVNKQVLRLDKNEYKYLKYLSHGAKNLYNVALYNARQRFIKNEIYSNYFEVNKELKQHQDYKKIPAVLSQQTIISVDEAFKSFFSLLKLKKKGSYDKPVKMPNYLDKKGFFILQFPVREGRMEETFSIRLDKTLQDKFKMKFLKIKRPKYIENKLLKEVRIVPKCKGRFFEIHWICEEERKEIKVDKNRTIAIDLGVNNFAAILDNKSGHPILLDGKKIKSINRYFNKNAGKKKPGSKNKLKMFYKRSRMLDDSINQYVNFILQYCIKNEVGNVVVGEGYLAQECSNMGKRNNQNFVNIPFGKFISKLSSKCELNFIEFMIQEEAYTSKCDHLAGEPMVHQDKYLGKRKPRGLFKSSTGVLENSDVHGALGIMLKSKHEIDLGQLVCSGRFTRPRKITLSDINRYSSIRLVD